MEYNIHHTAVSLINDDMLHNFYLHYSNIPTRLRYLEIENIVTTTVPLIKIILYISYRVTGLYWLGKTCYLHSLLCDNNIIAQFSVQ